MFNEEQEKALKQLENAFRCCKKAGIWFVGCNESLLVATHKFDMRNDSNKTYAYFESEHVNTHGAYIGEVLGKSEKAVRSRVYDFYRTENADKVRAMLGDGPWRTGKPELTVYEARRRAAVKSDLTRLMELLLIRRNELGYEPYWQRHMCMKWHDVKGCTAGETNCDECTVFERIRPQYCVRCGATFMEREKKRICEPCRIARIKQYQRKWRAIHGASIPAENTEQEASYGG